MRHCLVAGCCAGHASLKFRTRSLKPTFSSATLTVKVPKQRVAAWSSTYAFLVAGSIFSTPGPSAITVDFPSNLHKEISAVSKWSHHEVEEVGIFQSSGSVGNRLTWVSPFVELELSLLLTGLLCLDSTAHHP